MNQLPGVRCFLNFLFPPGSSRCRNPAVADAPYHGAQVVFGGIGAPACRRGWTPQQLTLRRRDALSRTAEGEQIRIFVRYVRSRYLRTTSWNGRHSEDNKICTRNDLRTHSFSSHFRNLEQSGWERVQQMENDAYQQSSFHPSPECLRQFSW
ncbi:hypothetical protein BDP81DRAFT_114185 [Colletotrichum phormii]|uniref:Uncharacterized protein n=1 Tax=Colletotrichum phormii TaxID=359342 RepID=A0AAI9ZG27_9PEZI|nr:uncharacterized protein BDP81DRAFT_114185 [Colletotrichum phormii]KAK1623914.1 hypothetical protein BDP81DRAFT_114185 [Colletotrichum phormii]